MPMEEEKDGVAFPSPCFPVTPDHSIKSVSNLALKYLVAAVCRNEAFCPKDGLFLFCGVA